ncbi:PREDICTED: double-strand-break repair protein rad21 homolog [Acropora digitifera]|uniref:double-strand-break repair protein rad21 homolog n=1 Tax=Acropora digitifera TaxID=70779 RepID=UPI00077A9147|nr:PREDICTED: double-strand-break repair protein rad21 homolog [Acropora digitifera]
MFYHQFILAKKAPLARVWLAAHWERKLSKALVSETDLPSSVESIISPKVKLALRTSGHLLLGVVRIYSRKTKYLLADCTEAFVKIKMAFRPGVVDLPEEGRELTFAAVTIPEVFTDLDMTLPELNEVEIHAQFTLNQGRIEEITMKEDIITNNFIGDDGFGDMFEGDLEPELARAGTALDDEPLYQSNDISKISTIDDGQPRTIIDSTLERSKLDIVLDEPIRDDGFGGEGVDFLADGFGDELGGDALVTGFDDLPTAVATADVTLEPVDTNLVEEKESSVTEAGQQEGVNETANETTLLPDEVEAFVLEPVEVVQKKKRSRRKRKLVVDDPKMLATEAIKSQLSDTTDIVNPATLAPPTKRRMKLKITSSVEKLFSTPCCEALSSPIENSLVSNLTHMDIEEEPEIAREEEDVSGIYEQSKCSSVSFAIEEPNVTIIPEEPIDQALEENERPMEEEEPFLAEKLEDIYPDHKDELEEIEQQIESTASEGNEEQQSSESNEHFENRRWTKRTQQVLHTLKRELQKKEVVNFQGLVHKSNRKQAAYKFYSCLLLSKESSIVIEQKKPFGDIKVSKGPKFDLVC